MLRTYAAIFGYNEYSKQILKKIEHNYREISFFVSTQEEMMWALNDGIAAEMFDLGDEWNVIEERFDIRRLSVFCALNNDAENVFLTISLRSTFESIFIIALAQNHESMLKMKSAGADKVMPVLQIAANVIGDIITKPSVTHVLHDILYRDEGLSVMEVKIESTSSLVGTYLHDIDFKGQFDLILLAMVDHERENAFSFAVEGYNHHIDAGDVLVLLGDKKKLAEFKQWARG
jgi:voltage-gated potassium channel